MNLRNVRTLTAAQPGTIAVFTCDGEEDAKLPVRFFAIHEGEDGAVHLSPVVQDYNASLLFAEEYHTPRGIGRHYTFGHVVYP